MVAAIGKPGAGRCVVEVHPAVALWLWCRERRDPEACWRYKKKYAVLVEPWRKPLKVPGVANALNGVKAIEPKSDDELDARVAYPLGRLWPDGPASVVLLGDADSGSFLIAVVPGIVQAFRSFVDGLPNADSQADDGRHYCQTDVQGAGPWEDRSLRLRLRGRGRYPRRAARH